MRKTKYIEVEVNMEDFDDGELVDELNFRGYNTDSLGYTVNLTVNTIYEKYKLNQPYDLELRDLFYNVLGKIP